jgi:hypothetical protein
VSLQAAAAFAVVVVASLEFAESEFFATVVTVGFESDELDEELPEEVAPMIAPRIPTAITAAVTIVFVFVVHFLLIQTSTSPRGEQQKSAITTIAMFSYQLLDPP